MCACVCVIVLTSCERPPADDSSPLSLCRLSLGELQPETGVLLLLGDESTERQATVSLQDNLDIDYTTSKINRDSITIGRKNKNPNALKLLSFSFVSLCVCVHVCVCGYPVCQVLCV